MKTSTLPLGLLSLCLAGTQCLVAAVQGDPTVVEIGPHHRVMQRTFSETLPSGPGRVRTRTTSYTELAVGMNYWKDGAYHPSVELIELFQDGAVFRQAQMQAIFAPNIATPAAIDLQTPSGRFQSHVLGLSIFNSANGQSEMVADIKDCVGELHPPNVIIYPDAFTDVRAAVRYVATRDRFEQDVIIFEKIPLPAGWDPAACCLEVWTEMVTAPAPAKTIRQVNNMTDETLDFGGGAQRIGSGRAFMLQDPQGKTWSAPMAKTWQTTQPEGRTFLVEAIEWPAVQAQLNALPEPQQGAALRRNGPVRQMAKNAAGQRIFPRREQAAKPGGKIQMAAIEEKGSKIATNAATTPPSPVIRQLAIANAQSPALVLDYSLVTTTNNFTFKGDTTWFISGNLTFTGTSVIEGGAVIKYTNGVTLTFNGPIDCHTGPYSPAIFTSWCDNTVGETILGSTGNPWTNYAASTAIYFDANIAGASSTLSHLRISHADQAFTFYTGRAHELSHIQIVHCAYPFQHYFATSRLRNVIAWNCDKVCGGSGSTTSTSHVEHATFNTVRRLNENGTCTMFLTNSLLVAVTNTGSFHSDYSGAYNASNSDPAAVFQTVGAGSAYLLDNTYRNLGTTNISPTLLVDLRKRTTYPPIELNSWVTTDTTLSPRAQRDTDQIDIGWHYAPLDYVAGGAAIKNATLTLSPGTALGCRLGLTTYAFAVLNGGQLRSVGAPDNLNRIVRYNTVQEQANTNWSGFCPEVYSSFFAGDPSTGLFRFTEWSVPASDVYQFYGWFEDGTYDFVDCQFRGGVLTSEKPILSVTNCLFHRVSTWFWDNIGGNTNLRPTFRSCLFRGGSLSLERYEAVDAWTFTDNLFDQTAIYLTGTVTADYNGYVTNAACLPLSSSANNAITNTSPVLETGALGRFYLPAGSLFIDRASATNATNAALFGFHHYTALTNNVPEGTNRLDIGFHYVAATNLLSIFTPFDQDGDGRSDYLAGC